MNPQPLILAIETSGAPCSVAVWQGNVPLAESTLETPYVHDHVLATFAGNIVRTLGLSLEDIDTIAVSAGPGSFTGLRIGFAFAKGLCFHTHRRLVMVPTLDALASAAATVARYLPECDIAATVLAHDVFFYVQHFTNTGEPLTTTHVLHIDDLQTRISSNTVVCGPGANAVRHGIHIPGLMRLTARFIAMRAVQLIEHKAYANPATAVPLYIQEFHPRPPQQSTSAAQTETIHPES